MENFKDWAAFFHNSDSIILALPGVIAGVLLYILLPLLRSPVVLPGFLFVIVAMFYIVLYATNTTLQETRDKGWVAPLSPYVPWYEMWSYFEPSKVAWNQVFSQWSRWIAMVIVVGFSSCLDVAAIEMESAASLDFNRELETVGWSNVCSGITGGFTGSYIFTQTIFSMRRDVQTRICGIVAALLELAVVLLPTPVTCYVPKFIFGSLLVLISADLLMEWLVCYIYSYV